LGNNIKETFEKLKLEGKKAFIPYIMAGDESLIETKELIFTLEEYGASIIEIGIPFSDPVADGKVIQDAGLRALAGKTNLRDIFRMVIEVRGKSHIPLVFMTYLNPLLQFGIDKFFAKCRETSVEGVIIPDMPIEEWGIVYKEATLNNVAIIPLVAPNSGIDRIKLANEKGSGYIYTVTVAGVTGARAKVNCNLEALLKEVKDNSTIPVVAGFGISTHEQVVTIGGYCDGVVVGSKIVELYHNKDLSAIKKLING